MKHLFNPGALTSSARLSLLTTALAFPVHAAPLAWNSAGPTNNWSTAVGNENWSPGGVVWTQNSDALFNGGSGTPESINVSTNNTVNDITFDVSGFSIGSAGAGSFLLANDLASTITVTNLADSASIAETIANNAGGSSTLTKAGLGTLTLNGTAASTYSGGTLVSAGTLAIAQTGALGTGAVTNAATLNVNVGNSTPTGLATGMSGAGIANVTLPTGANTTVLDGNYSGFTGTWNIGVGAAAGAGKVQMNGLDNAAATINVLLNGTVIVGAGTHNASIILNGGDTGESFGQLRLDSTAPNWAGPVILNGTMTGAGDGIVGCNSGPSLLSGNISETGGARTLSKAGGGTLILGGANSYSGPTRVLAGNISVTAINNTGNTGNVGTNSTIGLGNTGTGAALIYAGTGETTDRVIDLAGTTGGGTINQAGTGLLKFTSNFTATGAGPKTLTLNIASTGTAEISGQIVNNTGSNATTLTTAFAIGATTVTLGSVEGLTTGIPISGTGIAGGTTITAINTGTRVVTLSSAATGAGVAGQTMTATGVINPVSITKNTSLGTWTLSGNNLFTGNVTVNTGDLVITNSNALGVGPKTVTVVPTANPSSLSSLVLDGSGGDISLASNLSFTTSFDALNATTPFAPIPGEGAIINTAGNNTIAGNFTATSGGGSTTFLSNGGSLTLSGTLSANATNRSFIFRGDSGGTVSGPINNNGGNVPGVLRDAGTGTWTLSGGGNYGGATTVSAGTLIISGNPSGASATTVTGGNLVISGSPTATGSTTVTGGTLKLDYATNNTSKLAGTLSFNGGTVELAGGSHSEAVTSTSLTSGTVSTVTRSSGAAVLQMNAVTPGSGVVNFSGDNIASTDNLNVSGILPWARVGSVWGMNATNAADGLIVAYTGGFADVARFGGVVPDGVANNVRIVNGGAPGNITLGASPATTIGSLLMEASDGPGVIAFATSTDSLSIGGEPGGTLWQTSNSGALTLGATQGDGILTTGDVPNATPATLTLINESLANPLILNSVVANNGTDVVSILKGGPGQVILAGNNTFTGTVTTGGGALTLSGNNTFDGALTVVAGGTAILTGENSGRPAATTGLTTINNGGTLQLQANAGNTTAGLSTVLSVERSALQPLVLNSGGMLQLRSDSAVTFAGGNAIGGMGSATVNFDVNQITGAGSANTLTIAPLGFDVNTTTINVTGGNGYTLGLGKINNVAAGGVLTLNPSTGNLALDGYSANPTFSTTLVLGGTATGNSVTGNIVNPATSGATTVTKSGSGTWTISGAANTYTGTTNINDGTLKAGNSTAFNNLGALAMSGAGVFDLNGSNATFTNVSASAATNTITDNSAGAGLSTLTISNQSSTVSALIKDGGSKALKINLKNANTAVTPFAVNSANTFSGGLTLQNVAVSGTRLRIAAAVTTVGSPGAIISSPFGTGPITIGELATDKAGILLDTVANIAIANAIVFNTILGTDQPGIRVDTTGHIFSGTITANLSDAIFSRGGTGTGAASLTGQITGPKGLQLNASPVSITLNNATANANNYDGDTATGTGSTLILGAANQIPNGALKGNVVNAGTLNLGGFGETLNGLSGAGAVTSSAGVPVLTVGDNDATATFSGTTGGSLALTKTGSGAQTLSGVIGHSGDTTVSQGSLVITLPSTFADAADVRLTTGTSLTLPAGTDTIDQLFIDGAAQAVGKWGRTGSIAALGADFESGLILGDGLLNVTTSGTTPYSTWIAGFFPGETNPAIIGQTADPDKDGVDNLTEFAFAGNAASGGDDGKIYVFAVDSDFDGDTDKELILTAAIRTGAAAFGNGAPSTAASVADGITYSIQGSTTLSGFPTTVNAVPTAITTGLPAAGAGYSYRSFSLGGSNGLTPAKGFLRATVTAP